MTFFVPGKDGRAAASLITWVCLKLLTQRMKIYLGTESVFKKQAVQKNCI